MRSRHGTGSSSLLLALFLLACSDSSASPGDDRDDDQASADSGLPSSIDDDDDGDDNDHGDGDDAPADSHADAGVDATIAADASPPKERDAQADVEPDASTSEGRDAASVDSSVRPSVDGGSDATAAPVDAPAPVSKPLVWGFGIGITDLSAAQKFYADVMKMTPEKADVKRSDRSETILYAAEAKRGARIVLMKYDDMRNTRKITAKLVFQASSTRSVRTAAAMHPDYVSRLNIGIVQFDGPETYIHEVGTIFDRASGVDDPYPIAMGFVVSDLAASRRFYKALGMSESRTGSFSVTDATGSGSITEYTCKFDTGSAIVLQQWSPMRNAKDNPIKVVLMVPDAQAVADKVVAAGGTLVEPAARLAAYDNRLVVVTKDLDGYLLELVQ